MTPLPAPLSCSSAPSTSPPQRSAPVQEAPEVTPVPKRVEKAAVETLTCTFTVTATRERLKLLKSFLDSNGYNYN